MVPSPVQRTGIRYEKAQAVRASLADSAKGRRAFYAGGVSKQAVLPYMIAQKPGSMVNIVSIQAMEGMMTGEVAWAALFPASDESSYVAGIRSRWIEPDRKLG